MDCVLCLHLNPHGLGECTIFNGAGCEEGEECGLGNAGYATDSEEKPIGFCSPKPMMGTQQTGEECQAEEDGPGSNCVSGHLCSSLELGGPTFCIKLCQPNGPPEAECPVGTACSNGIFNGIDSIGICR